MEKSNKRELAMMGHREKIKNGDEWDVLYWKPVLGSAQRNSHKIKRQLSKRRRKEIKKELKESE